MTRTTHRTILLALLAATLVGPIRAQQAVLTTYVIGGGGMLTATSTMRLGSTAGQPIVGTAVGDEGRLQNGFWPVAVVAQSPLLLPAPLLLAPSDGAADLSQAVTLEWQPIDGAVSYDVQMAASEAFTVLLHDTSAVTSTTLQLVALEPATTFFWRVRAVNGVAVGSFGAPFRFTTAGAVAVDRAAVPDRFVLRPNHPNPFRGTTVVPFDLPEASAVTLTIYDAMGRQVRRLPLGTMPAGRHHEVVDLTGLAGGLYVVALRAATASGALYRGVGQAVLVR